MNGRVVWCFEWLSVMSEVWGEEVCNMVIMKSERLFGSEVRCNGDTKLICVVQ